MTEKPKTGNAGSAPQMPVGEVAKVAARLNVDMSTVPGTGPGGAVRYVDVLRASRQAAAKLADQARLLNVDMATVQGTGPNGQIVYEDIIRARAARPADLKAANTPKAPAKRRLPRVDASRNPLVAAAQANGGGAYLDAHATMPPTLFTAGDLPPFTSSGIDPSALLSVPWYARHAVAGETDRGKAAELLEAYSGPDGEIAAQADGVMSHAGNYDYRLRVDEWQVAAGRLSSSAEWEKYHQQVAAASAPDPRTVDELSDDEAYDWLFDPVDGWKQQVRANRGGPARPGWR
ncbi:E3 binding domain-containing protein [Streptosporangium sp. NPDC050855]|uniref:E3 binding domain-containing protein n=1 Tax=Streptosporangium sp. NPDC050855 TaxID=3366194 RepID=UPI0037BD8D40